MAFFRNESCLSTVVFILGKARFQVLLSVKLIIHKKPTVYQKQGISRPTSDENNKIQIRFATWLPSYCSQFCIVYFLNTGIPKNLRFFQKNKALIYRLQHLRSYSALNPKSPFQKWKMYGPFCRKSKFGLLNFYKDINSDKFKKDCLGLGNCIMNCS